MRAHLAEQMHSTSVVVPQLEAPQSAAAAPAVAPAKLGVLKVSFRLSRNWQTARADFSQLCLQLAAANLNARAPASSVRPQAAGLAADVEEQAALAEAIRMSLEAPSLTPAATANEARDVTNRSNGLT